MPAHLKWSGFGLSIAMLLVPPTAAIADDTSNQKLSSKLAHHYSLGLVQKRNIGGKLDAYSLVEAKQLEADTAAEIESNSTLLSDPLINTYLADLGRKLVTASDSPDWMFRFKVIDDETPNATSLPNGLIYINTGLLLTATDEAELAAVISHEIAHVEARHMTRASTRRGLIGFGRLALAIAAGGVGDALQPVASLAGDAVLSKFSRDNEREADTLGVEYLYLAGYDPQAMVELFQHIDANDGVIRRGKCARIMATHPLTSDRIINLKKVISTLLPVREQNETDTSEFRGMRNRLMQLRYPDLLRPLKLRVKIRPLVDEAGEGQ